MIKKRAEEIIQISKKNIIAQHCILLFFSVVFWADLEIVHPSASQQQQNSEKAAQTTQPSRPSSSPIRVYEYLVSNKLKNCKTSPTLARKSPAEASRLRPDRTWPNEVDSQRFSPLALVVGASQLIIKILHDRTAIARDDFKVGLISWEESWSEFWPIEESAQNLRAMK